MHCGLSWAPKGRSSRAHPLALESVVHEFPNLRVVIAHCGFPWVQDALMLALKYPNIYLDTAVIYSGTPTDSLRRVLAQDIGLEVVDRSLHHQLVFGSNFPASTKRIVAAIPALGSVRGWRTGSFMPMPPSSASRRTDHAICVAKDDDPDHRGHSGDQHHRAGP